MKLELALIIGKFKSNSSEVQDNFRSGSVVVCVLCSVVLWCECKCREQAKWNFSASNLDLSHHTMETRTLIRPSKCTLPKEKVFSIQIGSEIFRLSGASIASDGKRAYSLPSDLS